MFTGLAALAAGTVTTATVLAAVAEVGMVMTVVGGVTGNKDLMKIGGVMGLVGGVGGLINGAASGAATTAAASNLAEDSAIGNSIAAGGIDGPVSTVDGLSSTSASDTLQATSFGNDFSTSGMGMPNGPPATSASASTPLASATPSPTGTPDATAGAPAAPTVQAPGGPVGAKTPDAPTGAQAPPTPGGAGNGTKGPPIDSSNFFSKVSGFMDNNKELTKTLTTFGLGALKGIGANQFQQTQADILKQQAGNANSVVSTGAASTYNPSVGTSIFNRARAA